jgi:hypothetical protein
MERNMNIMLYLSTAHVHAYIVHEAEYMDIEYDVDILNNYIVLQYGYSMDIFNNYTMSSSRI